MNVRANTYQYILLALVFAAVPAAAQTPAQVQQALGLAQQIEALLTPQVAPTGTVTTIAAGADLQAALNAAQPGDTLKLCAGCTFTGNFVLPAKTGAGTITLTSAGVAPLLAAPPAGTRMTPAFALASSSPKLQAAPGGGPALRTTPGAHNWALVGLVILPNPGGVGDLVQLGDGSSAQNTLSQVPHDLLVDRCYLHGDPTVGQKRGIALNSAATTITNSYISEIKAQGQDSQAIAGWNGPGPFTITNNYLEASSENVLFGGADPSIPGLIPSNITISGNTITKPLAWRNHGWSPKNLLELKSAMHVVISGNVIEHVWLEGQNGFAIVLTVRDENGGCPQCTVQDVQVRNNVIRHVGAFLNVLALDDSHGLQRAPFPSVRAAGIVISGNLVYDVDYGQWGGIGRLIQVIDGPDGLTFDHNTLLGPGVNSLLTFQNGTYPVNRFVFTNNLAAEGDYGIIGAGDLLGIGTSILAHYAPGYTWSGNTILVGGGSGNYSYPTDTVVSAVGQVVLNPDFTPAVGVSGGANVAALKASIVGLDLTK